MERKWMASALACALAACGSASEASQRSVTDRASTALVAPPSGGDDTAVLQAALQGCVPGGRTCVVQLGAGTYRTRQLYANGFHGTLKGAGMDRTTVLALTPYTGMTDPYAADPDPVGNPQPHIVTFYGGADASVADLTFRVEGGNPAAAYLYGGCPVRGLKAAVSVAGSARFDRVGFEGEIGATEWQESDGTQCGPTPFAMNLDNGPMLSSWAGEEEFAIRSSRFRALGNGFEFAAIDRAHVTVGGAPRDGNVFERGSNAGLFLYVNASRVTYSYNRSTGSDATFWNILSISNFGAFSYDVGVATSYVIDHNQFSGGGQFMNAVAVQDRPGKLALPRTLDLVFTNNTVDIHEALGWGMLLAGLEAPLVANNTFTGEGDIGIFLDVTRNRGGNGGLLQANNVNRLTAATAPIVLLFDAHDVTVVGGGNPMGVLDLGTNDVIVGATRTGTGVGAALSEMMSRKSELRRP